VPDTTDTIDGALSFAEHFFQDYLLERKVGQKAFQYLGQRGYGREVAEKYGLGWAPDSWDALLSAAKGQGFSPETLVEAGLVKARRTSGHYDRFRSRLIFPLYDEAGKPLGFAGRLLGEDDEAPKYINSPTTERYDKDRYLYGMWRAARGIEATGTVLVTEGYTDVITLQTEGLINVVASSGTALTRSQLERLSETATRVVFAYDPDEAGIVSTIRGMKRALAAGLIPDACILPDGLDPHEFMRNRGLDGVRWWLEKEYMGFGEFLLKAEQEGHYEPDPSAPVEVINAASKATTEALRQMVLLDAARHLEVGDRELFTGGSQTDSLGLAT